MSFADVLIVGGGHGGAQAALALRQRGFTGSIVMVTREAYPPYERPPLSKDYLAGTRPFEKMLIRPESFWSDREIDIRTRCAVMSIEPQLRSVELSDGSRLDYHTLIWAAGGNPRLLPCDGADLDGVHAIRTRAIRMCCALLWCVITQMKNLQQQRKTLERNLASAERLGMFRAPKLGAFGYVF